MQNKPNIRNYFKILIGIIRTALFKDWYVFSASIFTMILTFYGSYLGVKATSKFSQLIKVFKKPTFYSELISFLKLSLFAITAQFVPQIIFTITMQNIFRGRFVYYLKEVLELDYPTFHSRTPGELQYSIFIKSFASPMTCQLLVVDLTSIVGTIIFGSRFVARDMDLVSAVLFCVSPLIYLLSLLFYIKNKMRYHYNFLDQQQTTSAKLSDKLLNYEAIKTYNLEEREAVDFYNIVGAQTKANVKMGMFEAKSRYMLTYASNIPFILMMVDLVIKRNSSKEIVDFLSLTLLYLGQSAEVKRLGSEIDLLTEYLNQVNFLSVKSPEEDNLPVSDEEISFNNEIQFKNVCVMYHTETIITDVNLTIQKGEKIAIVGKNGTGKSTLIKAILGFALYKGEILFDNQNTKAYSKKKLLELISYIPQDDCTSDDTVMNNLLLGLNKRDQEMLTKEQQKQKIKEIARKFNAHDAFRSLSMGYETEVGPRGNKLSGGQRQKISLVRACLKDAPIFIFDEATASLDKKYEKETVRLIFEYLKDKTILMIVHGKEYLRQFDKLIFLNEGKVEDCGTYDELMNRNMNFVATMK
ncbi:fes-4 [Nucleospora cyclopteri]